MKPGKVAKTLLVGDQRIIDSAKTLRNAVENYGTILNSVHVRISLKVYEVLKGNI